MKKTTLMLGASLLLPFGAIAGPSYNYIQADYIADGEIEVEDTSSDDIDGFAVKFSGALTPNIFLQGEHSEVEIDDGTNGADQDRSSIALGGNFSLVDNGASGLDAYGTVSYELLNDALDANGGAVDVGLRWLPIEQIEISPFVGYVDYGSIDNTPGIDVDLDGIRYGVELVGQIYDRLSLTASYRSNDLEVSGEGQSFDLDIDKEIRVGLRVDL